MSNIRVILNFRLNHYEPPTHFLTKNSWMPKKCAEVWRGESICWGIHPIRQERQSNTSPSRKFIEKSYITLGAIK